MMENGVCKMAAISSRPLFVNLSYHYSDVIMGAMASQIISLTIVYSVVYSDADQRKYKSCASLAFVRGEFTGHRWIPRTNGQWRGKCLHLMTSSCLSSAVDWESFRVGNDVYLIVSNTRQDVNEAKGPKERYSSVIYRYRGVEKFVAVHYLDIRPSADWEWFNVEGQVYLVYANAKDNVSQVLKVVYQ